MTGSSRRGRRDPRRRWDQFELASREEEDHEEEETPQHGWEGQEEPQERQRGQGTWRSRPRQGQRKEALIKAEFVVMQLCNAN